MSSFDWRSESAYDGVYRADTMEIAWEWLRRDGGYQEAYRGLTSAQRSSAVSADFRQQWGLSFRS
ncbi:transcriptional regulator domain-containing protein [Bradyrhizobium sp. CCGUVB23]|uniref:transcriptional regulator domain-containing protein n=1 Tax=Bradyrhizobium sp. CCGUVB23 TaxID=2949630 RepID=UPI003531A94C